MLDPDWRRWTAENKMLGVREDSIREVARVALKDPNEISRELRKSLPTPITGRAYR
jgi:hypothetical protein